jgi:RNA polymerase sigma factor (TIGR02999 family)
MSDVTRILKAIDQGEPQAVSQLLPLVYDELRRLAAAKMAHEKPGQTLDATGLVHEAYLRLVGEQQFANRRHFFAAAAEAMRRILIDNARRKKARKHGADQAQVAISDADWITTTTPDELLAVDEALEQLAKEETQAAELVKLRYYTGMSVEDAAEALGMSRAAAYRHWTYARAWLRCYVAAADDSAEQSERGASEDIAPELARGRHRSIEE